MTPAEMIDFLTKERGRQRISLVELATRAGERQGRFGPGDLVHVRLAHSTISTWENGHFLPNLTSLDRWARALGYELTLAPVDTAHTDGAA